MRKIICNWNDHEVNSLSLAYIGNFRTFDDVYVRGIHKHKKITEISLIRAGKGEYYIGDNFYKVMKGDAVVVNAEKLHSQGAILPSLIIGIEIPKLISSGMVPVVRLKQTDFLIMEKISFMAFELLKEEDIVSHQLASNLILKSFLPFFKKKISINEHVKKTTPAIVKRAKLFIDENFDENISIKEVCEALSVSHTYLDQKFRENVGMSPIKYLMSRRIGEAQRLLLEEPELSITQVSMRVGIYNRNYFQRNFKIFSGISPQQFRILIDKKEFDGRTF